MSAPPPQTIREVTLADTALLATLARQTFQDAFGHLIPVVSMQAYLDESFHPKRVAAEIEDPSTLFLLAEDCGEPAGYAKLYWGNIDTKIIGLNPIKLWRLYAASNRIGSGIGSALMLECINVAKSRGHQTLWLTVNIGNARAIAFYERFGFEITGESGFLLGGVLQQDHIMELALG
jgi:ribosomal protein S18 acetylase RimI-like enzyme